MQQAFYSRIPAAAADVRDGDSAHWVFVALALAFVDSILRFERNSTLLTGHLDSLVRTDIADRFYTDTSLPRSQLSGTVK